MPSEAGSLRVVVLPTRGKHLQSAVRVNATAERSEDEVGCYRWGQFQFCKSLDAMGFQFLECGQ